MELLVSLSTLPTEWGAVTLSQAAALAALGADAVWVDMLAAILGYSTAEVMQLRVTELKQASATLAFLTEPMPTREAWARPTELLLGEVEVPVLDTLEELSFGQAADIGAAIQELGADIPALRLLVLATILQPAYHGTAYDTDKVAEVEQLCGAVPLREALPLTDFFLPRSTASAGPMPPG